jgi:hypothetical protein
MDDEQGSHASNEIRAAIVKAKEPKYWTSKLRDGPWSDRSRHWRIVATIVGIATGNLASRPKTMRVPEAIPLRPYASGATSREGRPQAIVVHVKPVATCIFGGITRADRRSRLGPRPSASGWRSLLRPLA